MDSASSIDAHIDAGALIDRISGVDAPFAPSQHEVTFPHPEGTRRGLANLPQFERINPNELATTNMAVHEEMTHLKP